MCLAPPQLDSSWQELLAEEWQKPYLLKLAEFVAQERVSGTPIYPPKQEVFNAFSYTPFNKVNVVLVGQDPYHGSGQAQGLCFSVAKGKTPPPSLKNIFKEMQQDLLQEGLQVPFPAHGSLVHWAEQGVLLLNSVLTVRAKTPQSHAGKGWEIFTDAVISKLAEKKEGLIFVLWGRSAQLKAESILGHTARNHILLKAAHPSPYSAHQGFFGCRHFSKINEALTMQGKPKIDWAIPH